MRVVAIAEHGDADVLQVRERPDPVCGPGQVRIAVRAAGVNFADTLARVGLYAPAPKPPDAVVGYEVAGEVAEVGAAVRDLAVGDRVMAGTRFGGYAEQVVVTAADAVALPDRFTFAEGAAIPVNYATAWTGLLGLGSLRAGERVLVHAAAGGVGIAATHLAVAAGAEVHGTASPSKHAAVREQGVTVVHDYRRRGWDRGLDGTYDVVMDAIGGTSFRRSYRLLRPGGRLVAYGASSIQQGERRDLRRVLPQAAAMLRGFNLIEQMEASKAVIGLNLLALWDDRGTLEPFLAPLRERLDDGTIRPVVAAEVPFDRAPEAHRMLAERRNVGKVVLVP
jgi:NADPH:quinone reductase-like Zn-dependent oxidoreductase